MTTAEKRAHIKPFLRFALNKLQEDLLYGRRTCGLCILTIDYCHEVFRHEIWWTHGGDKDQLSNYLKRRLIFARPKEAKRGDGYWYDRETIEGIKKRIAFCKLQLKIVKP